MDYKAIKNLSDSHKMLLKRNTDINGHLIAEEITNEKSQIIKGIIVLMQLPSEYHRVFIEDFSEVREHSDLKSNEYYVDYNSGKVYFNPVNEGKWVKIKMYYGIGEELIPSSRVYVGLTGNGDIYSTLYEILKEGADSIEALDKIGDVITTAERIKSEMLNAISDGTAMDTSLEALIEKAKKQDGVLKNSTREGNEVITLVKNNVSIANDTNTTVLATISQANSKNEEVKQSINRFNQSNTTLGNTIASATNEKALLSNAIEQAKININSLNGTNDSSVTNKQNLERIVAQAKQEHTGLDESIRLAQQLIKNSQKIVANINQSSSAVNELKEKLNNLISRLEEVIDF